MNNITTFLFVGLAFVVGSTVHLIFSYGQNGTTTVYAPVVQSSDALLTAIVAIVTSVSGIIIALANRGILGRHSKEIGTVAVMAADTAWAVKDDRQIIKDGLQTTYDTVKISSPEATERADRELAPMLDKATTHLNEYKEKVDQYADIANKISDKGEKTTDEVPTMKDKIPNRIVPS